MNKIAIIIIGGLLISGIVFFLVAKRPKDSTPSVKGVISNTPTSSQPQLKNYFNDTGFSFKYPESLTLSEKDVTDDPSAYAWVELTNPKNKDVISIKLEDSNLAEIDDWFTTANKKDVKGEIKKIKLDDLDGRQFTDNESQLTTLALDKGGVLVTISGNSSSIHQEIVSSFIFTQEAQTTSETSTDSLNSDSGGGEDIIFEGEEIVE